MSKENSANVSWGGRFDASPDAVLEALNASIGYDQRMWPQDIQGSQAWATALHGAGVLTSNEVTTIQSGLNDLAAKIQAGDVEFSTALEDIHMNIESMLTEGIGDLGKKLHTGRSRNDQVCTDLRLYLRTQLDEIVLQVKEVIDCLLIAAENHADTAIPGYTHLQRAQPITLGFHFMTWVACLTEDCERLLFARQMVNRSPLGSAALAGTAYKIDRDALAKDLGFDFALPNAQMAVGDRGFVLDVLHGLSALAVHLSRIGEEFVVWNSSEFGRLELDDTWSTGSSIMPQKKNPDAAELLRGKCGRILSAYATLAVVQKGTTFAYNKDLQEDKEAVFDAVDQMRLCLAALLGMVQTTAYVMPDPERLAGDGHLLATELADYLVGQGVAFRDAHHAVGQAVGLAERKGCALSGLSLQDYQGINSAFDEGLFRALQASEALRKRDVFGGTHPDRVVEAIAWTRKRLDELL